MSVGTAADPVALLAVEDPELLLDAVIVTDGAGVITAVNAAFTRLHRYTADEVIGDRPRKLASGLLSDDAVRDLWATIAAGHPWEGELIDRGADGALRTVRTRIVPVRDPGGTICHYVAVQREVGPPRSGVEGHLRVDTAGHCTYADEAAAALLRRDADPVAMLGDGLLRSLTPEDGAALHEVAVHAAEVGRTSFVDLAGADGYVRCRVHPDTSARDLDAGAVLHVTCEALSV